MENQLRRKTDRFVISARELSSRGMSFIIVMLGVVLQASHTSLLMYSVSAFSNDWIKILVSLGIGIFISSALAIFTLKHDGENEDIEQIIQVFFYFEIFTNIFYYWNSLIFSKGFDNATIQDWLYLIIAMPFSFIMPYAIKKFAGIISADERLEFGSIEDDFAKANAADNDEHTTSLLETKIADIESLINTKASTEDVTEAIETAIDNFSKDNNFLQKGQNFELSVGDKKTIVTLE